MLKMLSPGTLGIGILAILAGLVGAYIIRGRLAQEPVRTEVPKPRTVPLATVDLPAGRVLTVGDVGLYTMTLEEMNAKKIDRSRAMMAPEQIIGRVVKEPIKRGQPFLSTSLYLEGGRPNISTRLKPGLRAFSLQIPKERGGGLESGALVDVLFRSAASRGESLSQSLPIPELTVMLMSGVQIIDIYQAPAPRTNAAAELDLSARGRSNAPPPPLVTLAVTPEQASKLQAVMGRGDITLIGRPEDEKPDPAGRRPANISLRDVLSLRPPTVMLPNDFSTEIYRRKAREVNLFRDGRLIQQSGAYPANGVDPAGNAPEPQNYNNPSSAPGPAPLPGPRPRPGPDPNAPRPESNVPGQNRQRHDVPGQNIPEQNAGKTPATTPAAFVLVAPDNTSPP